jgi:hypothetical protein
MQGNMIGLTGFRLALLVLLVFHLCSDEPGPNNLACVDVPP